MKIVSPEYGLILARIKINRWEIVLFHRSYTTLFDMSLATADLCTIFKEGQYQYVCTCDSERWQKYVMND